MTEYLTNGPISAKRIAGEIKKHSANKNMGGHSIFLGQVRDDETNGLKVMGIEYSAYENMIKEEIKKMKKIITDEFSDVISVTIIHSTGFVSAGEISLFVLVSAGHRDHAIRACRQVVEMIKERLPIWKKEIFEDRSHIWQENK
jgi:molybdopterin synthase catalytic subunit